MTVDIKKLERKMTPQAKPTTIPGKVVDALVGAVGSPLVSGLNTVASYHPNLNSVGEMFEQTIGGAAVSPSSSTSPSTPKSPRTKAQQEGDRQFALDTAKNTRDTSALEKLSSSNPNIARGDFDRTARAKGGVVSYKSISDMEHG
tara:strand:+ start:138 stop:572 length:435 start_codon:yes stop_codon:yes gene_type:complete